MISRAHFSEDGSQASGWMVPSLLGPFQGPRNRAAVRRNVILVELPFVRAEAFASVLEARGHRVLVAHQMREAVELVGTLVPDLVLLGVSHSAPEALISALQATYARGWRPQVLTDGLEPEDAAVHRVLRLLESH